MTSRRETQTRSRCNQSPTDTFETLTGSVSSTVPTDSHRTPSLTDVTVTQKQCKTGYSDMIFRPVPQDEEVLTDEFAKHTQKIL
jgi:hypothetical protein